MSKITIKQILGRKGERKITALTAYDAPSAKLVDQSEIDIALVGDSLGMVVLGFDSTLPVTIDDMVRHTQAVGGVVKHSLIVADMPFGSYKTVASAIKNARLLIQAGAEAVKLEGAGEVLNQIKAIVRTGISVMGHLGMLPQSIGKTGGYKVQGKTDQEAEAMLRDAEELEKIGVFAIVLECIPTELAKKITKKLKIPTIGIGAGPETDGQVLVFHDVLGFESPVNPKFVRHYADLSGVIKRALAEYRRDVLAGAFPSEKESFS